MTDGERAREEYQLEAKSSKTEEYKEDAQGKKISFPQWEHLDCNHIKMLLTLPVEQVQLRFEDILDFKNHQTCWKEAALLDYFVAGFWWAKEMNLTCQQISFILALLQQALDNIKYKQASFAENFMAFTQIVLAVRKSPSPEINTCLVFDTDQIKAITDYFKTSLFQHYRLYELLFTHQREQQLLGLEKRIEVISSADFAAPLEEGMPANLYFHYMSPPRVQTPEQDMQEPHEESVEEARTAELQASLENHTDFSVEDV